MHLNLNSSKKNAYLERGDLVVDLLLRDVVLLMRVRGEDSSERVRGRVFMIIPRQGARDDRK